MNIQYTIENPTENTQVMSYRGHKVRIMTFKTGKYTTRRLTWRVGRQRLRRAYNGDDPTKALAEAERILQNLCAAEGAVTSVRSEDVIYLRECQQKLGKTPLHVAVDFYLAFHNRAAAIAPKTFSAVAEEVYALKFSEKKQVLGRAPTGDRYLQLLRNHINTWNIELKKTMINHITSLDLDRILRETWAEKYGLITRKNLLGTMALIMRYAKRKGYIAEIPTEQITLPKPKFKTPDIFTPEELMKTFIAFKREAIPYLAIMAFGGGRRTEILKSTGGQINLEDGKIFIPPEIAKKNAGRALRIQANLDLWLSEFKVPEGRIVDSDKLIAPHKYKTELSNLGVEWKHNVLRHSFCTYFMELTDDAEAVCRQAGNSQTMLDRHYVASFVSKKMAEEWFSITPQKVRTYAAANGLDKLITW